MMADELPVNCRTPAITKYDGTIDPVEHLARFENAALLHRYTDWIKCRVVVTIFVRAAQQWFNQLPRFNTAALEVPSATQEVKASAFSQGLLDGDFFKSLAKKSVSKFDALLARTVKYINMEDAQMAKKESRGEKRKEVKEEAPSKKPRNEFREKKAPYQRINIVYTPLTIPITQALMAVEGKWLLTHPRSWKEGPQRPQSDKFCHFHNDYAHTTEECRHLKNEIERLIQNGYLQEYVCWEKARGSGPYQKKEIDKSKEAKIANPEASPKGGPKMGTNEKTDSNDPRRKGEVLDVEDAEDTPIIQFGRAEHSGPKNSHNDALVITALLANYEVGRIFINSMSSADILFGEAYDQIQLGDIPLEKVNTSLHGFAGEVVHPRGMILLPLTMGTGQTRRTCMLKFLVVDVPSAYNVILRRPNLNAFQAVISMYHMKIKFSTPGGVGKAPSCKRGKDGEPEEDLEASRGTPPKIQPAEELLNIELIPGDPKKVTRIGSQMDETIRKEVVQCLKRNIDIFAWTPQNLE
ncbi:UNVERIFIED_CONTAM: hypothetical protein Slati_0899100 [Sesamum latifolium]|uniref:Retrotransposon gag domain-containing protein n=1 Tax=Sesamum latifolium TaxID=2727402 RepID=A0AAW2XN72_9LAMI